MLKDREEDTTGDSLVDIGGATSGFLDDISVFVVSMCSFAIRTFSVLFPLQRWLHFRASGRSKSCSQCSAGLISALPLVPNRAPAAALASFPRFRSIRIVLPLQRWRHFQCHATACNAMLCCVPLCDATPSAAML